MREYQLFHGDCLQQLKQLPDNFFHSIVTDPPYGLSFMNKKWDYDVPLEAVWRECLRVIKPGGHLLSFAGTRTYHRMVVRIEDAGFEPRDTIVWMYGSGFPKSLNVGKVTESNQWDGWGTALKPAHEPIVLARKPLEGTVAANVLRYGTGGINIDVSRIEYQSESDKASATPQGAVTSKYSEAIGAQPDSGRGMSRVEFERPELKGRWPANVMLDEEAAKLLDAQTGTLTSGVMKGGQQRQASKGLGGYMNGMPDEATRSDTYGDSGGASRFFYCAKSSPSERDEGLAHLPKRSASEMVDREEDSAGINNPRAGAGRTSNGRANHHPTVKPIALMKYLIKLVTPPGGTVLDPFMGSGSTGCAAIALGFDFIGIEKEAEYIPIAEGRIRHALNENR